MKQLRRIQRAAALALALAAACRSTPPVYRGERAADLRDAGSVHLSVLAVAPWSEYVTAMQPNFTLSADGALSKVAADSRWVIDERSNSVQGGAQSVVIDRSQYGGGSPRELPGFNGSTNGDSNGNGSSASGLPVPVPLSTNGGDAAVGPDAMLKYTAATALFQEVQLLNRYIRDAAIPNGYRPYMVRVQVSLMPSRRHAPYDTYTTISFFIPGDRAGERAGAQASDAHATTVASSNSDAIFEAPFGNGPKVLPLLVTDNLEASVEGHSLERLRGLVYTLIEFPGTSAADQLVGGAIQDALKQQVLGRDLNSLLTVARLSENTLRIRIGAVQEATAEYAMVPRNHNVTLLLMVPEGSPPLMEVVSRTQLVDAASGAELRAPDPDSMHDLYDQILRDQRLDTVDRKTMRNLLRLAERNDQSGFSALLRQHLPAGSARVAQERSLWLALVTLLAGNQINSHLFELPGLGEDPAVSGEVFEQQTVVVEDDGSFARVVLREARFPEFERITATLSVPDAQPPILLPARSVAFDPSRRELRATFPSPQRLRLLTAGADVHPKLVLMHAGEVDTFDALYREVSGLEPGSDGATGAPQN